MKIVFLSNYFNHHQKYISEEFNKKCESFSFISTSEMREERKMLGYGENIIPDYVLKLQDDNVESIYDKVNRCDAVIIGSAPYEMVKNRIKKRKLVFRYAERPFKKGDSVIRYLPRYLKWNKQYPKMSQAYLLCASAYTAYDYSRYGIFKNRAYKWGYFPEFKEYNSDILMKNKDKNRILWCGRFIDWKHPDDVLKAVKRLHDEGYNFTLDFIGTGVMEEKLKALSKSYDLENNVSFHGSMKPSEVRSHMERAGIYLFTSDKQEGWGAVLNESMNSGCAVVASHAIGAVPYLVEHNKNGLIYRSGDVEMLYEKIRYLIDNPDEQDRFGRAAYETISKEWNAKIASERLVNLSKKILSGEKYPDIYNTGPCSKAEIIKDNYL